MKRRLAIMLILVVGMLRSQIDPSRPECVILTRQIIDRLLEIEAVKRAMMKIEIREAIKAIEVINQLGRKQREQEFKKYELEIKRFIQCGF